MAASCSFVFTRAMFLMVTLCSQLTTASTGGHFRGSADGKPQMTMIGTQAVEKSVRASLEMVVRGGASADAARLSLIEASLWYTFQSMPKNELGRLTPRSVRYLVHSYFAKEHGWLIQGLEPHGMQANMSEIHEVSILQDKVPALVEALLEARQSGRGLSLSEVSAMVTALERLIFDESIGLLEASYSLNYLSAAEHLEEEALHDVLTSYLLVFEMGVRSNLSDARLHQAMKQKISQLGGTWQMLVEFEQDAVWNYVYKHRNVLNPFVSTKFTFEAAAEIVEELAKDYGQWQNSECRQMKEDLISLDTDGSGLVPLSTFYSQPDNADYQFTESVDYLREVGAIDTSTSNGRPKVRIANYMAGPSNCIASHTYYSVCCLSECESWMNQLESQVQGPTAAPEQLLELVSILSSEEHALKHITSEMRQRLHTIGRQHDGQVPLHGRLFAQWLHYAFPQDCPYPHIVEDAAVLTPGHWSASDKKVAKADERLTYSAEVVQVEENHASSASPLVEWSHDEFLPLLEVDANTQRSALSRAVRVIMQGSMRNNKQQRRVVIQLIMFLVVLRIAIGAWKAAIGAAKGSRGTWKKAGEALPF